MGLILVQFLTGLASAASLFLIAAGLSIIFGVTRIVNFAHGSFYMLGAYIAYSLIERPAAGPSGSGARCCWRPSPWASSGWRSRCWCCAASTARPNCSSCWPPSAWCWWCRTRPCGSGGRRTLLGPRAPGLGGAVKIAGHYLPEYDLAMIAIAPAVLGGLWLLFHRTRWGVLVRAATQDREMVGRWASTRPGCSPRCFSWAPAGRAGRGDAAAQGRGRPDGRHQHHRRRLRGRRGWRHGQHHRRLPGRDADRRAAGLRASWSGPRARWSSCSWRWRRAGDPALGPAGQTDGRAMAAAQRPSRCCPGRAAHCAGLGWRWRRASAVCRCWSRNSPWCWPWRC